MVVLKVFCALKILYQLLKADFYYSQGTFESSAVRLKLNSIGFLTRAKASFRDMFNQKVVFSENNLFGKKIIDLTYHHQLSKNTSKKGLKYNFYGELWNIFIHQLFGQGFGSRYISVLWVWHFLFVKVDTKYSHPFGNLQIVQQNPILILQREFIGPSVMTAC